MQGLWLDLERQSYPDLARETASVERHPTDAGVKDNESAERSHTPAEIPGGYLESDRDARPSAGIGPFQEDPGVV